MIIMDVKNLLKKIWYFIWKDDSFLSWIVNVIIAFILVKFIIYPGIGLILSTTHPLVAVVSESMEHNVRFENWWEQTNIWYINNGITKEDFTKFRFKNGFDKGDIMILIGTNTKNIKIGDVIVFRTHQKDPIIHRVVKIKKDNDMIIFETKGDNNNRPGNEQISGETNIPEKNVIGKAIIRIPYLGWIKVVATKLFGGLI